MHCAGGGIISARRGRMVAWGHGNVYTNDLGRETAKGLDMHFDIRLYNGGLCLHHSIHTISTGESEVTLSAPAYGDGLALLGWRLSPFFIPAAPRKEWQWLYRNRATNEFKVSLGYYANGNDLASELQHGWEIYEKVYPSERVVTCERKLT